MSEEIAVDLSRTPQEVSPKIFPTLSLLNKEGKLDPSCTTQLSKETLLKGYRVMLLTRFVDERMITLQRQGVITFAMSAKGEEACAVASAAALENGDWIYPQYREAGVLFWRGFPIVDYVHQMFGDGADLLLGRQMPNHFGSRLLNVVTVSSPIGTKIPHAAGCAYAMKLQKEPHVAICYFGEGASSEGDFHAGLNFAAVRKAPVIFFCRNNCYAISTPCRFQFATDGVAPEGPGHGITTFRVDGNDFFVIYETVAKAKRLCLEGEGPVFIEAMTYRLGSHSTSDDPTRYRLEEESKDWENRCPIRRLRLYLEAQKWWDSAQELQWMQSVQKEVEEAITKAKQTAEPALASLIEHVYFEVPTALREQLQEIVHE